MVLSFTLAEQILRYVKTSEKNFFTRFLFFIYLLYTCVRACRLLENEFRGSAR